MTAQPAATTISDSVPLLDLARVLAPHRSELRAAFERCLDHGRLVLGPEVTAFEASLAASTGHGGAVGVSSGTDALLATFLALDLAPGDEVLTTAFTFISTATSVLRAGLRPVFVDLAADGFHPDAGAYERAWTPRTRAVLAVHLFGEPVALDDVAALCRRRGAALVEDCAQAIGARHADGGHVGHHGCAATLSFFPAKSLGGLGDGGAVLANDSDWLAEVRSIRQHGCKIRYRHDRLGGNFRLDALQAAMLAVLLPQLPGWIERRRDNATHYLQAFCSLADGLGDGFLLPPDRPGHAWNQFVVRVAGRDRVAAALQAAGVGHAIYYPSGLHQQPALAGVSPVASLPQTEQRCREVLALPVYPGLTEAERDRVVEVVHGACLA